MVCISENDRKIVVVWPAFSVINSIDEVDDTSSQEDEEEEGDETVYDW